jgi:hypothetical protein
LDQLKNRLLGRRLNALTRAGLNGYVRRAANEAVALAWVTQYPLLVFPALFDEMTAQALAQATRQEQIRRRSRELLTV